MQDVVNGGPADDAGLRGGDGENVFQVRSYRTGGDVITKIDGRPVDDPDDLSRAVALLDPGDDRPGRGVARRRAPHLKVKLGDRPLSGPQDAG